MWQPIETAPRDGTPVLLQLELRTIQVVGQYDGTKLSSEWVTSWDHRPIPGVACWMPLPEPPSTVEQVDAIHRL